MKKKSVVLFVLLVFLFCLPVFAEEGKTASVKELFPQVGSEYLDLLFEGYSLSSSTIDGGVISHLAPFGSVAYKKAAEAEAEENSFSMIGTAFYAYPEKWQEMNYEEKRLAIVNILTAISTQKGIEYISRTAGNKPKTLFSESYLVSEPENKKSKIEDPVYTEVPGSISLFSYQKDNRFGGNFYSLDYTINGNEVFLRINNITAMKFMGVTCVKPEGLYLYMDVILCGEGLLVCSMATVYDQKPTVSLVFYTVDLESSFTRRLNALKDWFFASVENT